MTAYRVIEPAMTDALSLSGTLIDATCLQSAKRAASRITGNKIADLVLNSATGRPLAVRKSGKWLNVCEEPEIE